MKEKLKQIFKVRGEEVEVFLVPDESQADLQQEKRAITFDQDKKDKQELAHETLKEMLKHHEDAVKNLKAEIS